MQPCTAGVHCERNTAGHCARCMNWVDPAPHAAVPLMPTGQTRTITIGGPSAPLQTPAVVYQSMVNGTGKWSDCSAYDYEHLGKNPGNFTVRKLYAAAPEAAPKAAEPSDAAKALAYYSAAFRNEAPSFVPARVRLPCDVRGDGLFRASMAPAGEHDCDSNKWGAISVRDFDGQWLGVKPKEFEVIAWRSASPEAFRG